MKLNDDGYRRPFLNPLFRDKPVADARRSDAFAKACPALNLDIRPYKTERYDPIWGELKETFTGYASDPEIRRNGSSGGVLSALAQYCLEQGLVDGVVEVRASTINPLENIAVVSRSRKHIIASCGSRYAPASAAEALAFIASGEEKFLFIGKPCEAAAVRQVQAEDPRLRENIPYILSFMCAGTPSLRGTDELLEQLEVPREELASFRYRGDGWPGKTQAVLKNGERRTMTYNESWGKVLNRHLQTRCKICPDGIGEFADIVCADGWEASGDGYPTFEEADGQSLILVRSDQGQKLFGNARAAGVVIAEDMEPAEIRKIQPFQYYRRTTIVARLLAMKLLRLKTPSYKGFELGKGLREIGLYQSFRAFAGFLVRRKKIKKRQLELA
ncbi:Coenzyme F420 hydrogenase/dehydrogenase, beta subunit C-terminal domain [Stutzerimonas tarimensis]|uniref:Coenzyme F420 hydrogenase/dehydrogenase, beta subunit C-terminal domain n=1 Tax=Stutzerimonas tarimensis TaxID=1507735 RepID=A0ABV7T2C0_9GAMM